MNVKDCCFKLIFFWILFQTGGSNMKVTFNDDFELVTHQFWMFHVPLATVLHLVSFPLIARWQ